MSRKKISTTIYVTPEQSDRLKLLHERTKVPIAVYIREGIDLVLKQYGHLLPGQLPLTDGLVAGLPGLGTNLEGPTALSGRSPPQASAEMPPASSVPGDKPERAAVGGGKG